MKTFLKFIFHKGQKRQADQNQNFQQKRMRTDNFNYNNNKFNGNNSFQNRVGKVDLRILLPSKVNFKNIKLFVRLAQHLIGNFVLKRTPVRSLDAGEPTLKN